MRFKIGENLPGEIAIDLRALGYDADTVFDESLPGAQDPVLMRAVSAEKRVLLTLDKGIANLKSYPVEEHSGLVLFRPARYGRRVVLAFIRERLPSLLELELEGRLTVVGPTRIRLR